jgi:biopolymer transport protein ExbB
MWELIKSAIVEGNPIIFLIFLTSFLAVFFFVERWLTLQRAAVDGEGLLLRLSPFIERGAFGEAYHLLEETAGALPSVFKAALLKQGEERGEMMAAMELQAMVEMGAIERHANLLSVIAHIAPLLGLLGTVLGFIDAFGEMRLSGLLDTSASKIGEAMESALLTTAAGLAVAIPTVFGYNLLVSKITSFGLELESFSRRFVDLLQGKRGV